MSKKEYKGRHHNWGGLIMGLGTATAVAGPINTYLRAGMQLCRRLGLLIFYRLHAYPHMLLKSSTISRDRCVRWHTALAAFITQAACTRPSKHLSFPATNTVTVDINVGVTRKRRQRGTSSRTH